MPHEIVEWVAGLSRSEHRAISLVAGLVPLLSVLCIILGNVGISFKADARIDRLFHISMLIFACLLPFAAITIGIGHAWACSDAVRTGLLQSLPRRLSDSILGSGLAAAFAWYLCYADICTFLDRAPASPPNRL